MQEVVFFSRRIKKASHAPLKFCNNSVKQVQFRKHLGVYLGGKLHFCEHLQNMFKEVNKAISLLRKSQNNLPRAPLATIYKSFTRPHLDDGDILYGQTMNNFFHEGFELIQCDAALAIHNRRYKR